MLGRLGERRADGSVRPGLTAVAIGAASVLVAAVLFRVRSDVVDDAYITFRAAENAAHGLGLTFDPGASPVESFSNPLLTLLLVATSALGMPSIAVARALGLAGLFVSAVGAGKIVRHAGGTERAVCVAVAATLGSFALTFYAWLGLETTFYAGLLTATVWRWLAASQRTDLVLVLLFVLVGASRPEAPLVLVAFLPLLARHPDRRRALVHASMVLLVLLSLLVLRWWGYGSLVPNTFFAKSAGSADHDPSTPAIVGSLAQLVSFVLALGLVLPFAALAAPLGRGAPARAALPPVVATLVFAVYAGGDWMPAARYLAPALPLVVALGALGLDRLVARGARPALVYPIALLAALAGSIDLLATATIHQHEFPYTVLSSEGHVAAARDMRTHLPPRARVVAFRIGALGWAGDFEVIDLLGLADREIARIAAAHPDYHPQRTRMGDDLPELRALVAARDPDAVLLVTDADADFDPAFELYGLSFSFVRSYPLGIDQAWALYRRERGGP